MNNFEIIIGIANLAILVLLLYLVPKRTRLKDIGLKERALILDSCALIDGRIIDVVQAGFTPRIIVIPAFIIRELQLLADGSDGQKRERARYGLDIAKKLQGLANLDIRIDQYKPSVGQKTDDSLIALSKKLKAQLYTTDFNLAKVAELEGVSALNVNELAQKLRPYILPGEVLQVKIIQNGSGRGQGVGYAEDGTMVVVDKASKLKGKTLDVKVERMINTVAGKMIFASMLNQRTDGNYQGTNKDNDFVTDLMSELSN